MSIGWSKILPSPKTSPDGGDGGNDTQIQTPQQPPMPSAPAPDRFPEKRTPKLVQSIQDTIGDKLSRNSGENLSARQAVPSLLKSQSNLEYPHPKVEGWLYKNGKAGFRKKYFRSKEGSLSINYYDQYIEGEEKKTKGKIYFSAISRWTPNGKLRLGAIDTDERGFEIYTKGYGTAKDKTFKLVAPNNDDYYNWTKLLNGYFDVAAQKDARFVRRGVLLRLLECYNMPAKAVAANVIFNTHSIHSPTRPINHKGNLEWIHEEYFLEDVKLTDVVRIKLYSYSPIPKHYSRLGMTDIKIKDLIARPQRDLILSKPNYDPLVNDEGRVSLLRVEVVPTYFPEDWPKPKDPEPPLKAKKIMMITRGTQGDVQPFVALARGLADREGFDVTICTELPFRDFVKANSEVSNGKIRFRPSGGDTAAAIDNPISQWAIQARMTVMQAAMIARAEAEFFPSHYVVNYWTEIIQPDVFIYGFTMATVVMTLSEHHKIPAIGFIFQPTCIPSKKYSAVVSISSTKILADKLTSHKTQAGLKHVMDSIPLSENINKMRQHYRLPKKDFNVWQEIKDQNAPLVIPIQEGCFGGKPDDWQENAVLTDFIFLRKGPTGELSQSIDSFIKNAKKQRPVIVIGFSSMPVPRATILDIVVQITKNCKRNPAVIALVGTRDFSQDTVPGKLEKEVNELKEQGRILEEKGAPFGRLFPEMDAIIIHGGLGTTAEALRVGVPVIVTGVLLMDQRFWGKRVSDLGFGPDPIHISDFPSVCVETVDRALEEGGGWNQHARKKAASLFKDKAEGDGVKENVDAFLDFMKEEKKFIFSLKYD